MGKPQCDQRPKPKTYKKPLVVICPRQTVIGLFLLTEVGEGYIELESLAEVGEGYIELESVFSVNS